MRAALVLTLMALLSLDVMPCGRSPRPPPPSIVAEGAACGHGYHNQCDTGLTCCQPDPRMEEKAGTCVKTSGLAKEGEACGVTSKRCCAPSQTCKLPDKAKGDGVCSK